MPPDFSDTYGSFIKGTDVPPGKEYELTFTSADVQEFNSMGAATGQNKQRKLVGGFRETTKLLIFNSTNARNVADAYGSNTDNLIGKKILISRTQTNMGPGILVRVPAPQARQVAGDPFTPAAGAPPPASADGDFDKEIPF